MGILNKIKGIFMEEVEEVVDEDTKALEKIKEKPPVAKKIETPREEKEEKAPEVVVAPPVVEPIVEEDRYDHTKEFSKPIELEVEKEIIEHKFPMDFDDKDFEMDERKDKFEVKEEIVDLPKEEPKYEEEVTPAVLYHEKRVDKVVEYDYSEPEKVETYGEKSPSKTGFQRSPIISPVWGILDKNYRKEEIVTKREIRLTTNNQKADLDLVREKAYGDLANDISESIHEEEKNDIEVLEDEKKEEPKEDNNEKDNLLYDLSENAQPSVKVVTMGDAEEYFNDLGLEYNVDYKVDKEEVKEEEEPPIKVENKKEKQEEDDDDLQDDELINLIDAMYESK